METYLFLFVLLLTVPAILAVLGPFILGPCRDCCAPCICYGGSTVQGALFAAYNCSFVEKYPCEFYFEPGVFADGTASDETVTLTCDCQTFEFNPPASFSLSQLSLVNGGNLQPNTTYYYQITTVLNTHNDFVTIGSETPPSPEMSITTTDTQRSIQLNWTPPLDHQSTDPLSNYGIKIYRGTASNDKSFLKVILSPVVDLSQDPSVFVDNQLSYSDVQFVNPKIYSAPSANRVFIQPFFIGKNEPDFFDCQWTLYTSTDARSWKLYFDGIKWTLEADSVCCVAPNNCIGFGIRWTCSKQNFDPCGDSVFTFSEFIWGDIDPPPALCSQYPQTITVHSSGCFCSDLNVCGGEINQSISATISNCTDSTQNGRVLPMCFFQLTPADGITPNCSLPNTNTCQQAVNSSPGRCWNGCDPTSGLFNNRSFSFYRGQLVVFNTIQANTTPVTYNPSMASCQPFRYQFDGVLSDTGSTCTITLTN